MAAKLDTNQFRLMLALGAFCLLAGAAMLWFSLGGMDLISPQREWTRTEGQMFEVGIRRVSDSAYAMVARYEYKIEGGIYHGSRIAGSHASRSAEKIRDLIVPYAPEAEEFSFQDLSELNPQRTWSVAYRPVVLRFDPFDMSRSELILEQSRVAVIVDWIVRIFGAMFVFTALTLFACAVPVSRRAAAPFN